MNEAAVKMGLRMFGMTAEQARKRGCCIRCKHGVDPDTLGEIDSYEYAISAICPDCWAELFPEEADE